jgi:type IV pilus assembly protein PilV
MSDMTMRNSQRGVFLLEVLIAIVIFAIGILAMISMQAVSIAAQNDSQYRAEAEHLIDQLTSQMRMAVAHDTTTGNVDAASFATFTHNPTTTSRCNFDGADSGVQFVLDWINTVKGFASDGTTKIAGKGLPGVTDARVQIQTDAATMPGMNQVRVTLCWQAANDKTSHSHSVVAYID